MFPALQSAETDPGQVHHILVGHGLVEGLVELRYLVRLAKDLTGKKINADHRWLLLRILHGN